MLKSHKIQNCNADIKIVKTIEEQSQSKTHTPKEKVIEADQTKS